MEFFALLSPTEKFVVIGVFGTLIIWTLAIKGYALWIAARRSHKWWFIILLVVNTLGILELIYLFAVAKVQRSSSPENPPTVQ